MKKKKSFLYWMGNILIWVVPLIITLILGLEQYNALKIAGVEYKLQFWATFVLCIILILYYKKGKELIKNRLLKAFVLEKKANPIVVLINGVFAILPIVTLLFIYNIITATQEDVTKYLELILIIEVCGRMCLVFDSIGKSNKDETE